MCAVCEVCMWYDCEVCGRWRQRRDRVLGAGKAEAIEPAVLTLPKSDNSFLKIFSHNMVAFKPRQLGDVSLAKIPTVAPED